MGTLASILLAAALLAAPAQFGSSAHVTDDAGTFRGADTIDAGPPFLRIEISEPSCRGFPPGFSPERAKRIWKDRGCTCSLGDDWCLCKYRVLHESDGSCLVQFCWVSSRGSWSGNVDGGFAVRGHIGDSPCSKAGPGWDEEFKLDAGATSVVCGQRIQCGALR